MNNRETKDMLVCAASFYEFQFVGEYIRCFREVIRTEFVSNKEMNIFLVDCFEIAHKREFPERIKKMLLTL